MSDDRAALRPYIVMLVVATIIAIIVAFYIVSVWNELRPILTQSPT